MLLLAKYDTTGAPVWKKQLGLLGPSVLSNDVATDSFGNVYITGNTGGALAGIYQGKADAFIAKYNSSGTLEWKQQLGTSLDDVSRGVAVDSNGNVYISGSTDGALAGTKQGESDVWLAKYNSSGTLEWKQQLGSSRGDISRGVATDSNDNIYISGETTGALAGVHQGASDAWVAKYNSSGTRLWDRQLGTSKDDTSEGVATDRFGNVYISGETNGALAGTDAWVAKYNSSGALVWKQQLGLFGDIVHSRSVATDSNSNVYISGTTTGALAGFFRGQTAFVAKYNSTGTLVWKQQLGGPGTDNPYGVATDSNGNVYISGSTRSTLGGGGSRGGLDDAWVGKITQ